MVFGGDEVLGGGGVIEGGPLGELGREGSGEGLVRDGLVVFEVAGEVEDVLADEPVAIPALSPFGEVDWVNGAVVEFLGEDGTDFGLGMEPFEESVGLLAILESRRAFFGG